jgi:hypothetical protein
VLKRASRDVLPASARGAAASFRKCCDASKATQTGGVRYRFDRKTTASSRRRTLRDIFVIARDTPCDHARRGIALVETAANLNKGI